MSLAYLYKKNKKNEFDYDDDGDDDGNTEGKKRTEKVFINKRTF